MTMSDGMKLLLKSTTFLMFVFSISSTKQYTPKKTERGGYVFRHVGIKLCQLKCVENGQCLSIEYDIETLTCRLSKAKSKKIKDGHVILAKDHSHAPTGSCTSSMCTFGQRCLRTRSGKAVCVQDEEQNDPEEPPLHDACRKGDLKRVRYIVSQGLININSREEKYGMTPLMVAAQEGHCRIFEFLIRKGANKSQVDNDGKNILHWACKGGHEDIVQRVLPQFRVVKNKSNPLLVQAAQKGNRDVFEFLVCTGSNMSGVDRDGSTILHHASFGGSVAIVRYIVTQGNVDINIRRKNGMTPLMMATIGGHKDVFQYLVILGADTSQVDDDGRNILHLASSMDRVEIVKYILLQNLVDINAREKYGKTAAMIAKRRGRSTIFNLLVVLGCPVK